MLTLTPCRLVGNIPPVTVQLSVTVLKLLPLIVMKVLGAIPTVKLAPFTTPLVVEIIGFCEGCTLDAVTLRIELLVAM
jgi:hypothetical protein